MAASTPASADPTPHQRVLGIFFCLTQNRALAAAAELEVADLLAEGPLHVDVLASRTNSHAPSLFRLLRALESLAIFKQVSPRVFANSPASEVLRKNVPGSLWALVRMTSVLTFGAWAGLASSIRSGRTAFDEIHGCNIWEFMQRNPEVATIFNEAMRAASGPMTPAVTAAYDWSRFPIIADIGGGIGTQLVDILNAHPSCRGILFDQPEVLREAIPHERMERISGDFFQSVISTADAYLLRAVVHDWAEPEALTILSKVHEAMKPDSRLALIEMVVPETVELNLGVWVDLGMMVSTGGRERTATEYQELLSVAGFELEQIVSTPSPMSILIAKLR